MVHNSYYEEEKQLIYASKMGLTLTPNEYTPYRIDMESKRVLDIGGGPVSLLLKCFNVEGHVIDPLPVPLWVKDRYESQGIELHMIKAEDLPEDNFADEAWIYNCLQHTDNPKDIIDAVRKVAKIIRIFEWIDTPINDGHIHTLTESKLNKWLGGEGKVEVLTGAARGKCYYGVFVC